MNEFEENEGNEEEYGLITEFNDSDFPEGTPDHYHGCDFCAGATWGEFVLHTDDCPGVQTHIEIDAMVKGIDPSEVMTDKDPDWKDTDV